MYNKMIDVKRHIAKTVSYRILGTCVTVTTALFLGADIKIVSLIGIGELLIKPIVYFLHERVWYRYIKYGVINKK
jgi:uncharacterized membrane protein